MRKKTKIFTIILLIFIILFIVGIKTNTVDFLLNQENYNKCFAYQNIELEQLFPITNELPSGWYMGDIGRASDWNRADISAETYYDLKIFQNNPFPQIAQSIYAFNKLKYAEYDYTKYVDIYSSEKEIPSSWNFSSAYADESAISCLASSCFWEARYGCIVIEIIGNKNYIEELEYIISLVDGKFFNIINQGIE